MKRQFASTTLATANDQRAFIIDCIGGQLPKDAMPNAKKAFGAEARSFIAALLPASAIAGDSLAGVAKSILSLPDQQLAELASLLRTEMVDSVDTVTRQLLAPNP